jgi:hypothetical protein
MLCSVHLKASNALCAAAPTHNSSVSLEVPLVSRSTNATTA